MSESLRNRIEALFEVAELLTSEHSLETLLNGIIDQVQQVMKAKAATLYLRIPGTDLLEVIGSRGDVADKIRRMRLRFGQGIAGDVARTRIPANVADAYSDPRFSPEWDRLTGFRTRQMLAMPMVFRNSLVGVLAVLNHHDDTPFDSDDERVLKLFSIQTAMVIHLAQERARHEQRLATTSLFSRGVADVLAREVTVTSGYLSQVGRAFPRHEEGEAQAGSAKLNRALKSLEHSVEQIRGLAVTLRGVVQAFCPTPPERMEWSDVLEAFHHESRSHQCSVFLVGNAPGALFTSRSSLLFVLDALIQLLSAESESQPPFLVVRERTDICDFCICSPTPVVVAPESKTTSGVSFVAIESAVALLHGEIFTHEDLAPHGAHQVPLANARRFSADGRSETCSSSAPLAQVVWQLSLPLAAQPQ